MKLIQKFKPNDKVHVIDGDMKGATGRVSYTNFKNREPICHVNLYPVDTDYFYTYECEILERYLETIK